MRKSPRGVTGGFEKTERDGSMNRPLIETNFLSVTQWLAIGGNATREKVSLSASPDAKALLVPWEVNL